MLDTLTVIAYLVGQHQGNGHPLRLNAHFFEKQNHIACVQQAVSPQLRWANVPPEANSLAVVVRDEKKHYYWITYNLPTDAKGLPLGVNKTINVNDVGINSFGQRDYYSPWSCGQKINSPVIVELYALDKRFSTRKIISSDALYAKIKKHNLAKAQIVVPPNAVT